MVILGKSSVGKTYLALALLNAACRPKGLHSQVLPHRHPGQPPSSAQTR
ncbi:MULTISPECIES: hypothetical protein [Corynebacterium]|nr:hypothetical protein [Corynebacterium minutissimum]